MGHKKTLIRLENVFQIRSNIQMKTQEIYTLTLDYTGVSYHPEHKPADRKTIWVRQTHAQAMAKVRFALEHGDHESHPLQSWKIDTGWQKV